MAKVKKDTTTKKTRKKMTSKKIRSIKDTSTEENKPGSINKTIDRVKSLPKAYFVLLSLILLGAVLYYFKGLFVAATINGKVLTRLEVLQALEKQNGSSVLDNLVTEIIVEQEAKNKGVEVTKEELDTEVTNIENRITEQGQKLDDLLALQGMTKEDLLNQLKLQKIVAKLVESQIEITDNDIQEFKTTNSASITPETTDDQIKEYVKQTKQQELIQKLISDLKANAKINYFVNYSPVN